MTYKKTERGWEYVDDTRDAIDYYLFHRISNKKVRRAYFFVSVSSIYFCLVEMWFVSGAFVWMPGATAE